MVLNFRRFIFALINRCYSQRESHNVLPGAFFRFTAAVRTSFNFSGQENMAFAGGEELWVFVNRQLAIQVFHDPLNSTIPCASINLSPALKGT